MKYFKLIFNQHYKLLSLTLFFLFIMSFDGIGSPYFWGKFTDLMTSQNYTDSKWIILYWMLFLLVMASAQFFVKYFTGKLVRDINLDMRRKVVLEGVSEGNFQTSPSDYITTITTEIRQIEEKYVKNILTMILCFLQGTITFIFLMRINILVGLLFALLGAIPSLIPRFTAKWLKQGTLEWQKTNKHFINFLEDFLDARRLIKRFNIKETIFGKLDKKLMTNEDKYYEMELKQGSVNTLISIIYVIALLAALLFGINAVKDGQISMGELVTIYMAADRVISPLITAVVAYNIVQSTEPILDKVLSDKNTLQKNSVILSSTLAKDDMIKFNDVTIGYEENSLIQDINVSIKNNEKILLRAESGTGKSTFIKSILSEIPVIQGNIEMNHNFLTDTFSIAMVEQSPFIFDETIWFNVTFEQDFSKEEVIHVLNKVGLSKLSSDEMLATRINRYSTVLSGGELKRIELARALLFRKPVLLIDEAFSGLDELNIRNLSSIIQNYPGTVIDIEHHIPEEMVENYDKVLTIKDKHLIVIKNSENERKP